MVENIRFDKQFILRIPLFSLNREPYPHQLLDEAIKIGSEVFHELYSGEQATEAVKFTANKYINRASHKCTPYGLFASNTVLTWSDTPSLIEIDHNKLKRYCRIDSVVQNMLVKVINKKYNLGQWCKYYLNNTIVKTGSRISYIDYDDFGMHLAYKHSSMSNEKFLEEIISFINDRLVSLSEIDTFFKTNGYKNSQEIIDFLIQNNIIIPETFINCVGEEQLTVLMRVMNSVPLDFGFQEVIDDLQNIIAEIDNLNSVEGVLSNLHAYSTIKNILLKYLEEKDLRNYIQVDSYYSEIKGGLNDDIQNELKDAVYALSILNRPITFFEKFKDRFIDFYGDKLVPVVDVVDIHNILASFLGGENFKPKWKFPKDFRKNPVDQQLLLDPIDVFLMQRVLDSEKNNLRKIVITSADLKTLPFQKIKGNLLNIFHRRFEKDGNWLNEIKGVSLQPQRMIGRFSRHDRNIQDILSRISTHNEAHRGENTIYAEIIHVPSVLRINNVIHRKHSIDHEIVYIAHGTTNKLGNRIPISDLYLKAVNGNIFLISKRLNKEIIPVMSNAHAFDRFSLPFYRLLNYISNDKLGNSLNFSWGTLIHILDHFPRVCFGKNVLSLECWKIDMQQNPINNENDIHNLRESRKIPNEVLLSINGDDLYINLDKREDQKVFIRHCKSHNTVWINEYVFSSKNNSVVKDVKKNSYSNELVSLAYIDKTSRSNPFKLVDIDSEIQISNNYSLGEGDWVYVRVYIDNHFADTYLITVAHSILQKLFEQGKIEKYFFIRYYDVSPHIRFRVKINPSKSNLMELIDLFNKRNKVLNRNLFPKIEYGLYTPEYNRYGLLRITEVESLFHLDSELALFIISSRCKEESKVVISLFYIMQILESMQLPNEMKASLIKRNRVYLGEEHNLSTNVFKQMNLIYRDLDLNTSNLLESPHISEKIKPAIYAKVQQISSLIASMKFTDQTDKSEFLSSYIHMYFNRLFNKEQRSFEFLFYDFFEKYLKQKHFRKDENGLTI